VLPRADGQAQLGDTRQIVETLMPLEHRARDARTAVQRLEHFGGWPGMSGTATVYAPDSKPLDMIGWLLIYGGALALYL
jgi:hypothetical protein